MSKENNNNKSNEQNADTEQPDQLNDINEKNGEETINNNDVSSDQTKREENPFSLKHFLKKDMSCGSFDSSVQQQQGQKVTGTRPKILLNNSSGADVDGKMKRSPKFFKSFDSQASLSEISYSQQQLHHNQQQQQPHNHQQPNNSRDSTTNNLYQPYHNSFSSDHSSSNKDTIANSSTNSGRSFFQRSQSTYDLDDSKMSRNYGGNRPNRKDIDPLITANFSKTVSPEISMALPDFVQDHIALEMFYSRNPTNVSPLSFEYDHLPDFAINENETNTSRVQTGTTGRNTGGAGRNPPANLAFDLMCNSSESNRSLGQPNVIPLDLPQIPLDLPPNNSDSINRTNTYGLRTSNDIPLDLTSRNNGFGNLDNSVQLPNADTFQTLPDFLSDGHIHSTGRQVDNDSENPDNRDNQSTSRTQMIRLRSENSRLRQELDNSTNVIDQQSRRIRELESTIEHMRNIENVYSDNLVHNMEKVEENIKRSNQKAAAAQSTVSDLKKKVKQLTAQVEVLRQENDFLKEGGAVGGVGVRTHHTERNQFRELSGDLMAAASNAESHLRQLLTGVENLRVLATQIESINNVIVSSDDFSDCEEDDFTGPAL